jgi:hypothetical protein
MRTHVGTRSNVRTQITTAKRYVTLTRSFDTGEPLAVTEYDVLVANPRLDVRRYEDAPRVSRVPDPEPPPPSRAAPVPAEQEQERPAPEPAPEPARSDDEPKLVASASSFTKRRVHELVRDNDLLSDIQSILTGKPEAPAVAPLPRAAAPQPAAPPPAQKPVESAHSIFEEIAAKMRYAQAYDLGAVELAERFDSFDSDPVKG